jgi:hypothetical protein
MKPPETRDLVSNNDKLMRASIWKSDHSTASPIETDRFAAEPRNYCGPQIVDKALLRAPCPLVGFRWSA